MFIQPLCPALQAEVLLDSQSSVFNLALPRHGATGCSVTFFFISSLFSLWRKRKPASVTVIHFSNVHTYFLLEIQCCCNLSVSHCFLSPLCKPPFSALRSSREHSCDLLSVVLHRSEPCLRYTLQEESVCVLWVKPFTREVQSLSLPWKQFSLGAVPSIRNAKVCSVYFMQSRLEATSHFIWLPAAEERKHIEI